MCPNYSSQLLYVFLDCFPVLDRGRTAVQTTKILARRYSIAGTVRHFEEQEQHTIP